MTGNISIDLNRFLCYIPETCSFHLKKLNTSGTVGHVISKFQIAAIPQCCAVAVKECFYGVVTIMLQDCP